MISKPGQHSLYFEDDQTKLLQNPKEDFKYEGWKRIKDIVKNDIKLLSDNIGPNDINQGALGDCYLLSVLSSLASQPKLLRRLFKTKITEHKGVYGI